MSAADEDPFRPVDLGHPDMNRVVNQFRATLDPSPPRWWWLVFVDQDTHDILGGATVQAPNALMASREAWRLGCNPGGRVAFRRLPDDVVVPLDKRGRLLDDDEAAEFVTYLRETTDAFSDEEVVNVEQLANDIERLATRVIVALDDYEQHSEDDTGYEFEVLQIVHRDVMNAMFTIEECSPNFDDDEFASHEHVKLNELGFSVDQGLEDLVRALWAKGAATSNSCIGDEHEDGYIAFAGRMASVRGADILRRPLEWDREQDCGVIRFPTDDVPRLTALAASYGELAPAEDEP